MNREPIERMIEILGSVKDENFYIGTYYYCDSSITKAKINSCGSTACALGHAAVDPWFMGRGMCAQQDGTVGSVPIAATLIRIFDVPFGILADIFCLTGCGVKQFYGVTFAAVTPAMVINKLKELLNT